MKVANFNNNTHSFAVVFVECFVQYNSVLSIVFMLHEHYLLKCKNCKELNCI